MDNPLGVIALFSLCASYGFVAFGFRERHKGEDLADWIFNALAIYGCLTLLAVVIVGMVVPLIPGGYELRERIIRSGFVGHAVRLLILLMPLAMAAKRILLIVREEKRLRAAQ